MGQEILIVGERVQRGELIARVQDLGYSVTPLRERDLVGRLAQGPGAAAVLVCLGPSEMCGLVKAVRGTRAGTAVPVLVVGKLDGEGLADVLELGADRFLETPVDVAELEEALAELAGPPETTPRPRSRPPRPSHTGDPALSQIHQTLEILAARLEEREELADGDGIDLDAMGLDAVPDVDVGVAGGEFELPRAEGRLSERVPRAPREVDASTVQFSTGSRPELPKFSDSSPQRRIPWGREVDVPQQRDALSERTEPVATAAREDVRRDRLQRGRGEVEGELAGRGPQEGGRLGGREVTTRLPSAHTREVGQVEVSAGRVERVAEEGRGPSESEEAGLERHVEARPLRVSARELSARLRETEALGVREVEGVGRVGREGEERRRAEVEGLSGRRRVEVEGAGRVSREGEERRRAEVEGLSGRRRIEVEREERRRVEEEGMSGRRRVEEGVGRVSHEGEERRRAEVEGLSGRRRIDPVHGEARRRFEVAEPPSGRRPGEELGRTRHEGERSFEEGGLARGSREERSRTGEAQETSHALGARERVGAGGLARGGRLREGTGPERQVDGRRRPGLAPLGVGSEVGEEEAAAVLIRLRRERFTGCLQVRAAGAPERRLWWSEGQVVGGESEAASESVLGRLLARGLLDARDMAVVARWSGGDLRRDVERLAQSQFIKPQEVVEALREPVRRIVEAVVGSGTITWALHAEVRPNVPVELGVPLSALIAGGVRRGFPLERLRSLVADERRPRLEVLHGPSDLNFAVPEALAAEMRWPGFVMMAERFDGETSVGRLMAEGIAEEVELRAAVYVLGLLGHLAAEVEDLGASLVALDRRRVRERLRLARESDYFALLGLDRGATRAEVLGAFADLTATFSEGLEPDSREELAGELEELQAALEEARDVLTDEALHNAYVAQIGEP